MIVPTPWLLRNPAIKEQARDLGLVDEDQDPFEDDCPARLEALRFRLAGVQREVVTRRVDRFAVAQPGEVLDEQRGLERIRVVVVEGATVFERQLRVVLVVEVVLDARDRRIADAVDDLGDHGCLS